MQAGGVMCYGILSLAFLFSFAFDLDFYMKLGYIGVWIVHGGILGMVSDVVIISYLVVALIKYVKSPYVDMLEIGIVLASFTVLQVIYAVLLMEYFGDLVMYMISGELKEICDKYGDTCSDYGILEKKNGEAEPFDVFTMLAW